MNSRTIGCVLVHILAAIWVNFCPAQDATGVSQFDQERAAEIKRLIELLQSNQFQDRQLASGRLIDLEDGVIEALAKVTGGENLEFRRRADQIEAQIQKNRAERKAIFPFQLNVDGYVQLRLGAARTALGKQAWGDALGTLQGILDRREDVWIRAGDKTYAGAQAEVRRLLYALPEAGLKEYQSRHGSAAQKRLQEATANDRLQVCQEVALRYPAAEAAGTAMLLLASAALERGDHVLAAGWFSKLLARVHQSAQLSALDLYKAHVAFRKSGDVVRAGEAWRRLSARLGNETLTIDGRARSLQELAEDLDKTVPLNDASADWRVYRGQARRIGQAVGGEFTLDTVWRQSTIMPPDESAAEQAAAVRGWVEDLVIKGSRQLEQQNRALLPAFQPIAVSGQVIYRTYHGISSTYLKDGEAEVTIAGEKVREQRKAGGPAWWSYTDGGAFLLFHDPNKKNVIQNWRAEYGQWGTSNAIFENSITGTLSTDGTRVYAVDDLFLLPHPQGLMQGRMAGGPMTFGNLQKQVVERNTLKAYSIGLGGSIRWELGGDHDPYDKPEGTKGSFFLGAPLPLADRLYVLNEKAGALRLICLRPTDGTEKRPPAPEIDWVQPLGQARENVSLDVIRRLHAAHLAYDDGVLVCPTNAGTILGVDLLTHSLLWTHRYRDLEPEDPQRTARKVRLNPAVQVPYLSDGWKATAPALVKGRVIFAAADAPSVVCLDLHTGRLLWKAPREVDDLYFAGAFADRVLITGRGSCRALKLEDGQEAWKLDKVGTPSGQGVAAGGHYLLPLASCQETKEPGVLAIRIADGTVVRRLTKAGKDSVPGNLIFADGQLISQTVDGIAAYAAGKK